MSIVIPTYNEKENIKALIKEIFALGISGLEVIIVDDSSTDGTSEVIRALRKRFPITIISRPKKLGLGSALRDGLNLAKGRGSAVICTMDADGSHDPQVLPRMLAEIERGADLAVGSRRVWGGVIQGWGPIRLLMSRVAMEIARRTLGIRTRDVTSGFRAYRRRVLETIELSRLRSTGYAFQEELLYRAERAGFKIVEVPITFIDRRCGRSKLGIRDILEFFGTVLWLKFQTTNPKSQTNLKF